VAAKFLASSVEPINNAFLRQFPEFNAFRAGTNESDDVDESVAIVPDATDDQTPEEALQIAYRRIRDDLAAGLIDQIKAMSPTFFVESIRLRRVNRCNRKREGLSSTGTSRSASAPL
jgi:restriction endonuclease Mrr